jgi:hypothetical protein
MKRIFGTPRSRTRDLGVTLAACALAAAGLTACTTSAGPSAATSSATDRSTAVPSPTLTTDTPTPSATSASPTPTPTTPSPTPTASPTGPPAQTVQDVAWDNARLPVMCGGPVEMVQLKKGAGKTTLGLVVEYLDVTFGSVTSNPVDNIAVVQLDCIGAHPGPVDAPVFRSGPGGAEFLGFATMSLDRFGSASVSTHGIVIHGTGFSDTAAGCCPDLAATMISSITAGGLALQERSTVPLGKAKPGSQCKTLNDIAAQSSDLAKQTRGHVPVHTGVVLAKVTPAIAAQRAQSFLDVLSAQLQRGCP